MVGLAFKEFFSDPLLRSTTPLARGLKAVKLVKVCANSLENCVTELSVGLKRQTRKKNNCLS